MCTNSDALSMSNEVLCNTLRGLGRHCEMLNVPGFHSFLGFPIQWTFGWWLVNTVPATEAIAAFLCGGEQPVKKAATCMPLPFDWSILIVIGLTIIMPKLWSVGRWLQWVL